MQRYLEPGGYAPLYEACVCTYTLDDSESMHSGAQAPREGVRRALNVVSHQPSQPRQFTLGVTPLHAAWCDSTKKRSSAEAVAGRAARAHTWVRVNTHLGSQYLGVRVNTHLGSQYLG
jgi:hypothetical protein